MATLEPELRRLLERQDALDASSPPADGPTSRARPNRHHALHGASLVVIAGLAAALVWSLASCGGGETTASTPVSEQQRLDDVSQALIGLPRLLPRPHPTPSQRAADEALAERFAPVLRLSSSEPFLPIAAGSYVALSDLLLRTGPKDPTQRPPFDHRLASLPHSYAGCPAGKTCRFFLDVRGLEPKDDPAKYADLQNASIFGGGRPRSVVYWHVTHYASGDAAVQYWFLYLFNAALNRHEADWEEVTVHVSPRGAPVEALYSAHDGGVTEPWSEVRKLARHPVDFVALGSHANYFRTGRPRVAVSCKRKGLRFDLCAETSPRFVRDVATGCGTLLVPGHVDAYRRPVSAACAARGRALGQSLEYELRPLVQPSLDGYWGFGNYLLRGRIPVGEDGPQEPQRRAEWRDPLQLVISERGRPVA